MSIVMGIDQHRAQITAEWIDTATGEISRGRVRPADRAGVRRFLARFAGQRLEVALERELAPVTRELRFYARRQTGCKALIEAYYGIGELCAVTIVSELCRHATRVDRLERSSGRNASPSGITPSNISSPAPELTQGSWTEVSRGARAQRQIQHAHAPPERDNPGGP